MKIYYHNDLDGRCAAAIAYRATKVERIKGVKVELIELDYKDEIGVKEIHLCEKIFIVDFSFKPEIMEKVLLLTKNIVWIDHHKIAFEYKYSQKVMMGIRDNKFSGCELVWKYFYGEKAMPRAVELIGDRDKWAWKFGKETAHFNVGLQVYDHQPKDTIWDRLFRMPLGLAEVPNVITKGKLCLKFRDQFCENYCKSYGFETEFEGYKCFALGLYMFGSEAFGNRIDKYDVLLSFEYLGNNWVIGLYSKKVDVSKIAVKYGGGGHSGYRALSLLSPGLFKREEAGVAAAVCSPR